MEKACINISVEQNRDPSNRLEICNQLIFDKGAKGIAGGKDSLLNK